MRSTGFTRRRPGLRFVGLWLAVACIAVPLQAAADDEPLLEGDLPDWIPSIGFGIAIQSRSVDGQVGVGERTLGPATVPATVVDAVFPTFNDLRRLNELSLAYLKTDIDTRVPSQSVDGIDFQRCFWPRAETFTNPFSGQPANPLNGFCAFDTNDERVVDGASLPVSLQLMGPPAKSLPGRPRLFGQGTYGFNFDRRLVVGNGLKTGDFSQTTIEGIPLFRLELEGEPIRSWFLGGGVAIRLPVERPFFVKLGGHYSQDTVNVLASIDRGLNLGIPDPDGNNLVIVNRATSEKKLTIPGAGPSVGIEAEVVRWGPLAVNFSLDLFVTFATGPTDTTLSVDQGPLMTPGTPVCTADSANSILDPSAPVGTRRGCVAPVSFEWESDHTHYYGAAMVRLAWIGR